MSRLLSFREDLRRARDGRGAAALARASREEIAWLAGLLDGEACFVAISYGKVGGERKRYRYPQVQLVQTDRDLVERAAWLMGGTVQSRPPRRPGHKSTYRVTLSGWPAVDVMLAVRGWMSERRVAQIDELVGEYEERQRQPRDGQTRYSQLRDRAWLLDQYVVRQRSAMAIGRELGCTHVTVTKALRRAGIDVMPAPGGKRRSCQFSIDQEVTV